MGVYINLEGRTKEEFLKEHAIRLTREQAQRHDDFEDLLLVVYVDQLLFSAAAVAHSAAERDYFLNPDDTRYKQYFLVEKKVLPAATQELINQYQGKVVK